jgi:hypothetical protein
MSNAAGSVILRHPAAKRQASFKKFGRNHMKANNLEESAAKI